MKTIKDPVHGYIQVDEEILPLLDSPLVQRLRYVKQLGFSYLVYPGANHTRFEHSLGTMHFASLMSQQIGLPREDHLLVVSAALLHDIGHGPFSHAIEGLSKEILGWSHTRIRELITAYGLDKILENIGVSPDDLCSLVEGVHPLARIIHGELDVDRMDYLLRDAHYTGVPYGTVDAGRIIRTTRMVDGKIVLHESGVQAAESLLIARTLMRPAIYYHHVSRIAEKMFECSVFEHIAPTKKEPLARMVRMDDCTCIQDLMHSQDLHARTLITDLYFRNLYKRVLYVGRNEVPHLLKNDEDSFMRERKAAEEIAEATGISPRDILVDVPAFPRNISMEVQVQDRNMLVPIEDISPLINTLNETRRSQWRMGVYTKEQQVKNVYENARSVLHVKNPTRQERLL